MDIAKRLTVEIRGYQLEPLYQLVKRITWTDVRKWTESDDDASSAIGALERIRLAIESTDGVTEVDPVDADLLQKARENLDRLK